MEAPPHGGDLAAARRLFPGAPEPFLDLSTGINPHSYPLPPLPVDAFTRLPEPSALDRLTEIAATYYGAPSRHHVVAAPGTQILMVPLAALRPAGRAAILAPTYAEYACAAAQNGHEVRQVTGSANAGATGLWGTVMGELATADLAILANPNNPDGRLVPKPDLLRLAAAQRQHGGLLIIDEAFMDAGLEGAAGLADAVDAGNIVVLRSFGKFFGLAGVRLGFAVAAPPLAARLAATLGPWAVSGAAIAIGTAALADSAWTAATRKRLADEAQQLDAMLAAAKLDVIGGTALFRLVRTPRAGALFDHLGRAGIFVRRFAEQPFWLRLGLPANEAASDRLAAALANFYSKCPK
jgi:cobalamin biosynthesis protein CobC